MKTAQRYPTVYSFALAGKRIGAAAMLFVFNDDGTVELLAHCVHSISMLVQELYAKLRQKIT